MWLGSDLLQQEFPRPKGTACCPCGQTQSSTDLISFALATMSPSISTKAASPVAATGITALVRSAGLTVLTVLISLSAIGVQACEKHLNGHQNGSDTNQEVQSGSQQR